MRTISALAVVLCIAFALSFAGCDQKEGDQGGQATTQTKEAITAQINADLAKLSAMVEKLEKAGGENAMNLAEGTREMIDDAQRDLGKIAEAEEGGWEQQAQELADKIQTEVERLPALAKDFAGVDIGQ